MDRDAIKSKLLGLLKSRANEGQEISDTTNIVLELNLDSLQLMELVADIEDGFGIEIPLEYVQEIKTLTDAVNLIQKLANSKTQSLNA